VRKNPPFAPNGRRAYELAINFWVKIVTILYTSLPNRPTVESGRKPIMALTRGRTPSWVMALVILAVWFGAYWFFSLLNP
jgi:hypothetical protein